MSDYYSIMLLFSFMSHDGHTICMPNYYVNLPKLKYLLFKPISKRFTFKTTHDITKLRL